MCFVRGHCVSGLLHAQAIGPVLATWFLLTTSGISQMCLKGIFVFVL